MSRLNEILPIIGCLAVLFLAFLFRPEVSLKSTVPTVPPPAGVEFQTEGIYGDGMYNSN
jgi:hypothetical protein